MEKTNQLLRDIDKHMRAEWYAGRLSAESWPKSLSDRLAAAVADPAVLEEVVVSKNEAGHIVAVTRQDAEGRVLSTLAISAPIYAAPAAVAVVPEPDFLQRHEDVCGDEVGPPTAFYTADTVRALLATATGLPAQADMGNPIAQQNQQVEQAQADARDAESEYQRGYRHGYNRRDAEVQGALL